MKLPTILFALLIFTTSCALTKQERKMNRATKKLERLVTKFPELKRTDTLYVDREVIVPRTQIDTVTALTTDTVTITQDRLTVRYRVDTILNTVWVDALCDTLVIRDTVQVPCDTIQPTKVILPSKLGNKWLWFFAGVAVMAIVAVIFRK